MLAALLARLPAALPTELCRTCFDSIQPKG
jgi:hypothetical protein